MLIRFKPGLRPVFFVFGFAIILSVIAFGSVRQYYVSASTPDHIMFNGNGVFDDDAPAAGQRFTFIIHCDSPISPDDTGNCSGVVGLRDVALKESVQGKMRNMDDGSHMMTVSSRTGNIVATLQNVPPSASGPKNTVHITFGSPAFGNGTCTSSVIQSD